MVNFKPSDGVGDYGDKLFREAIQDIERQKCMEESDGTRRARNILAAFDNLLTQMDGHESDLRLVKDLRLIRSVYEFEYAFYKGRQ